MRKKSAVSLCVLVLVVAALVTPTYARLNPLNTATRPALERPAAQLPRAPNTASASSVLILYDSSGEWGWIGQIHARLLANLLGHFPVTYKASAVESYRRGDVNRYSVTFYIGSTYDNPLPSAFVNDVMTTSKPVCWLKYNIWQLAWSKPNFSTKFGFTFNWLDWTGYDTIGYNGQTFKKHQADPELGLVWVLDPTTCQVISTACRTPEGGAEECIPYIVRGGNLWYVADLPFSYITEEDRYLVFCDLLYDILGFAPPNTKRAIARIEDVDPTADPQALREIADYLYARGVPFAVSVIPVYTDPLGFYNNGVSELDRLSRQTELIKALKYMTSKGGKIILHGYTHQYDSTPNPYNGVTGDDFEFYRIALDANNQTVYANPVPEDSRRWAADRVSQGISELKKCGLTAVAWETPHYAASAVDYQAFASKFPLTIQRVIYFDLKIPASGFKGDGDPTYFGGQFFPYVINRDLYGQKVLPENLGSYEPDPWEGYRMWLVADILRCAEKNTAMRDAWASFYFHPFYDIENLQQIVEGIQAMGYTFVPISQDLQ